MCHAVYVVLTVFHMPLCCPEKRGSGSAEAGAGRVCAGDGAERTHADRGRETGCHRGREETGEWPIVAECSV